jgi:hypothetical protein
MNAVTAAIHFRFDDDLGRIAVTARDRGNRRDGVLVIGDLRFLIWITAPITNRKSQIPMSAITGILGIL